MSFLLPVSRPAAGRAAVGARAAAVGPRSPPKRGEAGPGMGGGMGSECRPGQSPPRHLAAGGTAQAHLAAVRSAERAGRRGCSQSWG